MKMMRPKCKDETHEILTSTSFKLTRMIIKTENKKENKNLDSQVNFQGIILRATLGETLGQSL